MDFAHHERRFCPLPGFGIKRQSACANLAACLEGENVDAGKQERIRNVRSCVEEEGVGVLEEEKRGRRADGHDVQKEIVSREWRPEVERHSRGRRQETGEEVPRVESSLYHALAALAAACVCCCLRHRRNSTSLQITIFNAELTTWSGVLWIKVAYFSTATAMGSCSSYSRFTIAGGLLMIDMTSPFLILAG